MPPAIWFRLVGWVCTPRYRRVFISTHVMTVPRDTTILRRPLDYAEGETPNSRCMSLRANLRPAAISAKQRTCQRRFRDIDFATRRAVHNFLLFPVHYFRAPSLHPSLNDAPFVGKHRFTSTSHVASKSMLSLLKPY